MKKIPKVFANEIRKKIDNNETYSYTKNNENQVITNSSDIKSKINEIFKSKKYIYKIDVYITLKDGIYEKRIIGKKDGYIITIDNELININDIIDIKLKTSN